MMVCFQPMGTGGKDLSCQGVRGLVKLKSLLYLRFTDVSDQLGQRFLVSQRVVAMLFCGCSTWSICRWSAATKSDGQTVKKGCVIS